MYGRERPSRVAIEVWDGVFTDDTVDLVLGAGWQRDHGFTSIWVSNHGGRQLETAVPTIDCLPAIREAVGPDTEIILDGGVMRGTDIAKAIALGADSVGCGKAYLYGLAAGGRPGVAKAIDILQDELERAMGLLGTRTVADLKAKGPELIRRRNTAIWPPQGIKYKVPKRKPEGIKSKFAAQATAE